MGTDLGQGDVEQPWLTVSPADANTTVTLVVHRPDGTSAVVPATPGALEPIAGTSPVEYSQRWTGDPVVYDAPGRWVLAWTVTGAGEGAEEFEAYVVASPVAGGPAWLPGRSRVANYVPTRTLERNPASIISSQDAYELTFTANTRPTGLAVDRLIADGAAWVTSRVHPLNTRSEQAASVVVALYAAAAVERGTPEGEDSLQRANDLERRLDRLMADLISANSDANDEDAGEGEYALEIAPAWSFPPADPRWDDSRYF